MTRWISLFALAGAVAACNGQPEDQAPPVEVTATPTPTATASAAASSNGARAVAEETDDFLFEYAYPAAAGQIAGLAALLDGRLDRARRELARESGAARRTAAPGVVRGWTFGGVHATCEGPKIPGSRT